ncbi:MAG TPA: hypothetical protein VHO72_08440 [Bacteroidales bacterium]|nr:hypothetical protein [Bacteroidales bacterium]
MRKLFRVFVVISLIWVVSGFSFEKLDYRAGMHKNVCKDLKHDILLYFIFVDSKTTAPWTEFDIKSTLDSVGVAVRWLLQQAQLNNIPLNIKTDYFIGNEYSTISRNLPGGTIEKTATMPNLKKGMQNLNDWADQIARKAGAKFNITQKDGIPEIKLPRNKERLIAFLRDEYKVESVALIYFVNNYFKADISIAMNTLSSEDIEYAIVSYKYPAEIAHNFLHLYGAADMYPTLFRRNEKKARELARMYPNEIMLDPYARKISDLTISEYTKYLIGWTDSADLRMEPYFTDKHKNF